MAHKLGLDGLVALGETERRGGRKVHLKLEPRQRGLHNCVVSPGHHEWMRGGVGA